MHGWIDGAPVDGLAAAPRLRGRWHGCERDGMRERLDARLSEFCKPLRALVRARVSPALGLDVDEIEQEVRLKLWRVLEREPEIAHPVAYLHRAVMSVVVDHVRRQRHAPLPLPDDEVSVPDDAGRQASSAELGTLIEKALAQLPERRRLPVALHLQGFGLPQIARMVRDSEAAVRNLVYRGLDELRSLLAGMGVHHAR